MDGVIIDTEPLHQEAKRAAFGTFGLTIPDFYHLDYRGRSDVDFAEDVGTALGLSPQQRKEVLHLKHSFFEAHEHSILLVDGSVDFLHVARPHFAKMALTTSATSRNQQFAFDQFGLHPFFDVVINASHITRTKPDPEPYLTTIAQLGLPAEACLVIEDSRNGILSGKGAGCQVAAITTSYSREELLESPADLVVDSFQELAKHLGLA